MIPDLPLERWRRIEPILDRLLDFPPAERNEALETACDGDPALRAEVEAFLAADEAAGGFLDTPAGEYAVDLLDEEIGEQEGEDLPSGGQIGPYRLVREIGSGGMGVVYEAEDSRLRRRVAIKFLPPEYSRDRRAKERFLREARAASCLDHPNLCTVYDVGESNGRVYIVLAYYEGETLKERLRRGPLPIGEARDVAIQVARGLACAHEAGIIHRDIKPANVMITRRGEVKILDFGVAKQGGEDISLTPTGGSLGTPAYMSPEQVQGETVDGRTDIWSLGVMLYEMLASRRPFGGEGVQAVLSSILTREPEPIERLRPEVPPVLALVAERSLAKDPAERYGSATELLADLERGSTPAWRASRRRYRVARLWAGAVTVLVLVALALGWFFLRSRAPLRVAVLSPKVTPAGNDPEIAFVASQLVDATLDTLLSLERVQPLLDPPKLDEGKISEAQRLREAHEVLEPFLGCRSGLCIVRFRRFRQPEHEFLGTVGPFPIPTALEDAKELTDSVRANLREAYRSRPLRVDAPGNKIKPQDYAAYIQLERRIDQGEPPGTDELEQLDSLLKTSPDLLGAYLLAAGIASGLGDEYVDRALDYAASAQALAPSDPRPLFIRLRVEVEAKRLDAAQQTLERLVELAPTDVCVLRGRAELLEARGELKESLSLQKEVVRRRPTWEHKLVLASMEVDLGEHDSARGRLQMLLEEHPGNQYVLEHLVWVELTYGDPKRAAELYEKLIRISPAREHWTMLGWARFLLHDYAGAEVAYRRALELEPGHLQTRFNLATAREAQGNRAEAQRIFHALAQEFEAAPPPDPHIRMLHAQCLARQGHRDDAARLAEEILGKLPDKVQTSHQAAQLYALLEDKYNAIFYTKRALEKGLRREWFTIPEFESLKEDPEFRALLDSASPKTTKQPTDSLPAR